ncbi:hypothetical protein RCO48_07360 [Peribacillus frigoritolerans]|nr:hypothetical protein [Peribacillus frigoritolerans]
MIGTEGTTPAGKRVQGRHRRRISAEEASRTARGKRVPEVEINVQILHLVFNLPFTYSWLKF